jgi:hypothetical protein
MIVVLSAFTFGGCASDPFQPRPSVTGVRALHGQFLDARARMDEPYIIAGEGDMGLMLTFRDQLNRLGDERFAAALSQEPPDVVAAVWWFVDPRLARSPCPKTIAVLASAPPIRFAAVRATEEDLKRP